jgi:hexaprenyl-diphosphate synthase
LLAEKVKMTTILTADDPFPVPVSRLVTPAMPLVRHRNLLRNARALATSAAVRPIPIPTPLLAESTSTKTSISSELSNLKSSLFHLLGSSHPSLDAVAKYYFQAEGKHLRPMIVLLMSRATNGLGGSGWERMKERERVVGGVDESLTSVQGVLNDWNPEQGGGDGEVFAEPYRVGTRSTGSGAQQRSTTSAEEFGDILSTQRRLASITEMIHVASLLHDDVIDASPLRRGAPSAPQQFSNKLSILGGDFLLGRASVALARLGNREVVELLATVVANLVEGEVMQMRAGGEVGGEPSAQAFEVYMRKTYLKTASLMAKSARASVILGGCGVDGTREEVESGERVKDVAYAYGRNLGIAFQVRYSASHRLIVLILASSPAANRRPTRLFTAITNTRQTIPRRRPLPRPDHRARPLRMAHKSRPRTTHRTEIRKGRGRPVRS